jgi:hypothetical protein
MAERARLTVPELDVSGFTPRPKQPERPIEAIREASEKAGLVSREPTPKPPKKADRRRRTGRNDQLNIKCTADTKSEWLALYDTYRLKDGAFTQGELLQLAVSALRELDNRKAGE